MMTRIHNLYVYVLENLLLVNYDVFVGSYILYCFMTLFFPTIYLVLGWYLNYNIGLNDV